MYCHVTCNHFQCTPTLPCIVKLLVMCGMTWGVCVTCTHCIKYIYHHHQMAYINGANLIVKIHQVE
ncbi:hypothetical protein Scep_022317 [Stephania cephalantha]|uniref:Uncharacterized protein n=1 Tax=Stephania cephalantha TaxID=152367 RepID=A0AAP0FEK9_9MAGN